jgi:ABC-2 type transport system permease protein
VAQASRLPRRERNAGETPAPQQNTMPIFDQGYQHWKGSLAGHAWRWMVITKQGLIGQIKSSRSYVRLLLISAWMPALTLVIAMALWGLVEQRSETIVDLLRSILPPKVAADPHAYRHAVWTIAYSIFFRVEIYFIMLLVVLVGPNLISQDLRFNALPLYFSRPITRFDYFIGKLGVIAALVAALAVLPAVAAYILGICFSLDLSVIRDTWRLLPASILYGLVIVVSAGTLMLALSSLSRRSLYVGIAWIGLWIVGSTVSNVLEGIQEQAIYRNVSQQRFVAPNGAQAAKAEAAKTDWRLLFSYPSNLQRIGDGLLDADTAWVEIGRAVETPREIGERWLRGQSPPANERRFADKVVLQYPWIWSAGVLAGLLGLSICILSTRIKSLDRLK